MPAAPAAGWKLWVALIGPGVVLAGTSIGSGEWLFGPAVTAQYGAAILWLALLSILGQAFGNLMMQRYAIYCGEPILVGALRTRPGPVFWLACVAVCDLASIWPYNASNAAVPLAAVLLGRLPTDADVLFVRSLGVIVFVLAFVPLIFGGTVYRMLERIMTAKLVLVLGYLSIVAVCMVSLHVFADVLTGFLGFGTIPLRADTIIAGRHFSIRAQHEGAPITIKGSWDTAGHPVGDLLIGEPFGRLKPQRISLDNESKVAELNAALLPLRKQLLELAESYAFTDRFFVETREGDHVLAADGSIVDHHHWRPSRLTISSNGQTQEFTRLDAIPAPHADRFRNLLEHEGMEYVNAFTYIGQHGALPMLDWAVIVSFIGIAGAGGLTNTFFSNYARDKGWGMGRHVGAIPSAVGALTIGLSHTGRVFPFDDANRANWRGWMRHILRDQLVWVIASIIGMALPCMMSLEFIRNAPVTGDRVAAMTAEGIAERFPSLGTLFWILTLSCGFLVLAPGQVSVGDQIARRWTDMIWSASDRIKRLGPGEVWKVYYGILALYFVWGLIVLWKIDAKRLAQIGAVLQTIPLGLSFLLAIYVNRSLLPRALQPHWLMQACTAIAGVFFVVVGVAAAFYL